MKLKKLPVGQSSFENIIKEDNLYIDKTRDIYNLINSTKFNFLSRPRRFGKSLLISTLEQIFKGNRELFKGLWIYDSDYEWKEFPIIRLDMNTIDGTTPESLIESLRSFVDATANSFDVNLSMNLLKQRFEELIVNIFNKVNKPIVILIDEYDKPIINHLGRGKDRFEIAIKNRDILKEFYGTLKAASVIEKLHFLILTGISKFAKAGVFSELNNLFDLTMDYSYAGLLGITEDEIDFYFKDYIEKFIEKEGISYEDSRKQIRNYYNGYRFSKNPIKVYNPFSVINFFAKMEISNYWFESGTPTFLVNLIKEKNYYLPQTENYEVDETVFTTYDLEDLNITALLFQTGYLTIKEYNKEMNTYILSYPNLEVKNSFLKILYRHFLPQQAESMYLKLHEKLRFADIDGFISIMKSIFASITYEEGSRLNEANFHALFYVIVSAGGIPAKSQMLNSFGRIDMVIEMDDKIYIIEFKCNQSADTAIKQIINNSYHLSFLNQGRKIYLLGINFDSSTRNISEYKIEVVS